MKSQLELINTPQQFPYLGINNGMIVLFNSDYSGMILVCDHDISMVGHISETFDHTLFRPLGKGERVILSNEGDE